MNWIKQQNSKNKEKDCFGVDPNRNWAGTWNKVGGSHSPCSDYYIGPNEFSEPETRALSKFLMQNRKYIKVSRLSSNNKI